MMFTKFERILITSLMTLVATLVFYVVFAPFHSQLQGCEIATVVDKQFTGRDNDIPTLYVRAKEIIDTKTTDNETYFGVEIGGNINYCTYVDFFFPAMTNFTTVERIER